MHLIKLKYGTSINMSLTLQITPSQSKIKTSTVSSKFSAGSVSFNTLAMLIAVLLPKVLELPPLLFNDTKVGLERKIERAGVLNPDTRVEDVAKTDASKVFENLILALIKC